MVSWCISVIYAPIGVRRPAALREYPYLTCFTSGVICNYFLVSFNEVYILAHCLGVALCYSITWERQLEVSSRTPCVLLAETLEV